jgi:hypothetical protein
MIGKKISLWVSLFFSFYLLSTLTVHAVELKMFVNEPQGGRCTKDIKYAKEIFKEVSNVTVTIVPKFMSSADDPDAPAVMIDGEVVAENNGPHNGCMDKSLLIAELVERGAIPYSEGYRIINSAQLKKMVDAKSDDILVVDARNPEEYQEVHIPRSVNLPEKKFDENQHLLPDSKKTTIVFTVMA